MPLKLKDNGEQFDDGLVNSDNGHSVNLSDPCGEQIQCQSV